MTTFTISSGQTSSGITLNSGDTMTVNAGGVAISTTVNSGGTLTDLGTTSNTMLFGGEEDVSSGGVASGTTNSGGTEQVNASGTVTDSIMRGTGAIQFINSGGVVIGETVSSGGSQILNIAGARASGTVVSSGGILSLDDTNTVASGAIILNGGTAGLFGVGEGVNWTVSNGGTVLLENGGGGTLLYSNSGTTAFDGVLSGSGAVIESGPGTLQLSGTETNFGGTVGISGGTVELTSGGAAGTAALVFGGGHASLRIDGATMPTNTISAFVAGDTIDLAGIPFSSGDTATYSGSTLTVSNSGGAVLATLTLTGKPYTSNSFVPSRDPTTNGIDIGTNVPCFARGTLIRTERGEIPVEELAVGEWVETLSGVPAPIVWVGNRRVDCRRHCAPGKVWPVRIEAGAFGEGLPRRDLHLSPDHALFFDGVLIPIKHLIDGAGVAQERVGAVHYFHVELDRHDVLLAEGLPAESYLDTGNRAAFANGTTHVHLHPDFSPLSWDNACAPLCTGGAPVFVARRHLAERMVARSGLHVSIDDRIIRPAAVKGRLFRFIVPAGAREARIVLQGAVPADAGRRPGVCLGGILLDGRRIAPDRLAPGAVERSPVEPSDAGERRRTDGEAVLELDASAKPAVLDLLVRCSAVSCARELATNPGRAAVA